MARRNTIRDLSASNRTLGFFGELPRPPTRPDGLAPSFADAVLLAYALRAPGMTQGAAGESGGPGLLTPAAFTPGVPSPEVKADPGPPFCEMQRAEPWLPLECKRHLPDLQMGPLPRHSPQPPPSRLRPQPQHQER